MREEHRFLTDSANGLQHA